MFTRICHLGSTRYCSFDLKAALTVKSVTRFMLLIGQSCGIDRWNWNFHRIFGRILLIWDTLVSLQFTQTRVKCSCVLTAVCSVFQFTNLSL